MSKRISLAEKLIDYVKFLKEHEDLVYDDEKHQGFFSPPESIKIP